METKKNVIRIESRKTVEFWSSSPILDDTVFHKVTESYSIFC